MSAAFTRELPLRTHNSSPDAVVTRAAFPSQRAAFLFAALDAATGYPRHRGREFLSFPREIERHAQSA
jgi:hypothetical protein